MRTAAARGEASLAHLFGRLAVVERRVAAAVASRRASDPDPGDRFRGLYVSDDQVDAMLRDNRPRWNDSTAEQLLLEVEAAADEARLEGARLRLRELAEAFKLLPFEVDVLLVALAPDLDVRFERLYGYLHDDVTRRRASPGLVFELLGVPAGGAGFRGRLAAWAPLGASGLVLVEDAERPFLTRSLRVPDRIASHLLGDDSHDPAVAPVLRPGRAAGLRAPERLVRALDAGAGLVYLRDRPGASGAALAEAALSEVSRPALHLDLAQVDTRDAAQVIRLAAREARLTGAGLVAGPVEALSQVEGTPERVLAGLDCPVVICGSRPWDPAWSERVPLVLEAAPLDEAGRSGLWATGFGGSAVPFDPAATTGSYRLTAEQVRRAAEAARLQALAEARDVSPEDVRAGARMQNAAGLERLARRVAPAVGFDDLVLPSEVLESLHAAVVRACHRDTVFGEWAMAGPAATERGLAVLFAGPSGTGKTMAAEVVAGELGLDLYVIDLATVVDKYVGETEKNLDRVFAEAERVNGVLLFDEADAIFGKRSEVRDAHDRYANIETAYLLQRIERFEGIAILATNLRSNLDEAFTRRLDLVIDFPEPEREYRLTLWDRCLGLRVPRGPDLDLEFMARSFKLTGGNIRNITVAAAFAAAADGRALAMVDLVRATRAEYRKLGRLVDEREFGPYLGLVAP